MRRALVAAATLSALLICALLGRHFLSEHSSPDSNHGEVPASSGGSVTWIKGFVVDSATGEPMNATCLITVRLFDAPEGGRLAWGPEQHPETSITDGWFSVQLASRLAPVILRSPPYYLEFALDGEAPLPRTRLDRLPPTFVDSETRLPDPASSVVRTDIRSSVGREPGLPGETYADVSPNGAWCWIADPRSVFHDGMHRRTYSGHVNASGDIVVTHYDHDTGEVAAAVVHPRLQVDDHANPAILVRPDGRLAVFYSGHRGAWLFFRVSTNPEDITSWGNQRIVADYTTDPLGHTYPNPVLLSSEGERAYVFWRGPGYRPVFSTSEDWDSWGEPTTFLEGGERPYVKVYSDGAEAIHFAFTNGHPRVEPTNSIYYMCYRDGALYRADGSRICDMRGLPVAPSESDLVYNARETGARAWIWDLAVDSSGNPVIVYAVFPAETDHRYRYAAWDGSVWEDHEIVYAGPWFPDVKRGEEHFEPHYSGGIALDYADPTVVYLSRSIDGVFEIERWTTLDSGKTRSSEPITSGSSEDNVRPLVPRGLPPHLSCVLWMQGDYTDYTDYGTAIKIRTTHAAIQ